MAGPWSPEQRARHAATVARKRAEAGRRGPTLGLQCDVCGISGAETKVIRFGLTVHAARPDGRDTTMSAGAIDLCESDWTAYGRRRRQRRRYLNLWPSNARSVREIAS